MVRGLKILEKLMYKTIIDFLNVTNKYNLDLLKLDINIIDYDKSKILKKSYLSFDEIFNFYKTLIMNKNNNCEYGNDIYIDLVNFSSILNNETINYSISNLINTYKLTIKNNNHITNYDTTFLNNQKNKIDELVLKYKNIYLFILSLKTNTKLSFYSPCYSNEEWTLDINSSKDISVLLKYNLFNVNLNNIKDKTDLTKIKQII